MALLTKYKDKDDKITKWGRVALVGVIASALITAATQSVELIVDSATSKRNQEATLAQLKTNSKLLSEMNRTLNPLEDVRASFWLGVELDKPELSSYVERLEKDVAPLVAKWNEGKEIRSSSTAHPSVRRNDGSVEEITIRQDSRLFPQPDTERFAHTVFEHSTITMHFFKTPIEIEEFPYYGYASQEKKNPDLTMHFEQDYDSPWDVNLEYKPKTGEFRIRGNGIVSEHRFWNSTGRILSVTDLEGSQVFVTAGHTLVSFEEREKRVHPTVQTVILEIGARKGLWFRSDDLDHHIDVDGDTIYEYRFPNSAEELVNDLR